MILPLVLSSHEEATVRCAKARPGSNSSTGSKAPVRLTTSGPHVLAKLSKLDPVFIDRCDARGVMQNSSHLRKEPTGSNGANSATWCLLLQTQVRRVFVVVADIVGRKPFQVSFIERDNMIQQITAPILDPTPRDAVLSRTFEVGSHRPHPQGSDKRRPNPRPEIASAH
jgi:hypothetical protein